MELYTDNDIRDQFYHDLIFNDVHGIELEEYKLRYFHKVFDEELNFIGYEGDLPCH